MAFQAVPDAAEIVIQYQGNTKNMVNTLAAFKPGGYSLTDLIVLANAVDVAVAVEWLPFQSVDYNYLATTVRGLAFENDQEHTADANAGPGLLVSDALPGNVTFSVKRASSFTGRSARGRLYWLGLGKFQLQSNENLLNSGSALSILAGVEAMRVAITTGGWSPAIVSRFSGGVQRPVGVTFEWTNSANVNLNIDSQRRRLIR